MIRKSVLDKKDFYKPGEIARMLNCTPKTINNYTDRGYLEAVRTESNFRNITKESLLVFLEKRGLLLDDSTTGLKNIIYACVYTDEVEDSEKDLKEQLYLLKDFVFSREINNVVIMTDVVAKEQQQENRMKIFEHILRGQVNAVYVINKEYLFGREGELFEKACQFHRVKIVAIHEH